MIEEWRDIKGYEGQYQVSNLGSVRSLSRIIHSINRSDFKIGNVNFSVFTKFCKIILTDKE